MRMTALQTSPIDTPAPLNTEYPQPLRLGKDSVAYKVLIKNPVAPLLAGVPALALQSPTTASCRSTCT